MQSLALNVVWDRLRRWRGIARLTVGGGAILLIVAVLVASADDSLRARSLRTLRVKQPSRARALALEAHEVSTAIIPQAINAFYHEQNRRRDEVLRDVAAALTWVGQVDSALNVDTHDRDEFPTAIVSALVLTGDLSRARTLVDEAGAGSYEFAEIAERLVERGHLSTALRLRQLPLTQEARGRLESAAVGALVRRDDLRRASRLASEIADSESRATAFASLALGAARKGRLQEADNWLRHGLEALTAIPKGHEWDRAAGALLPPLALLRKPDDTLGLFQRIETSAGRGRQLLEAYKVLVAAGRNQDSQALERLIRQIADQESKANSLLYHGEERGQQVAALRAALEGKVEQSIDMARALENRADRLSTLSRLSLYFRRTGRRAAADAALQHARREAGHGVIAEPGVLSDITVALAEAGLVKQATTVLKLIPHDGTGWDITTPVKVGIAFMKSGHAAAAASLLSPVPYYDAPLRLAHENLWPEAAALVERAAQAEDRVNGFLALGESAAAHRRSRDARFMAKRAEYHAASIPQPSTRGYALIRTVQLLLRVGQSEQAEALFKRTVDWALALSPGKERTGLLVWVATWLGTPDPLTSIWEGHDQIKLSHSMLQQAHRAAGALDAERRAQVLAVLAARYLEIGRQEEATAAARAAREAAAQVTDASDRAQRLSDAARVLARAGLKAEALSAAQAAHAAATAASQRPEALSAAAIALAAAGDVRAVLIVAELREPDRRTSTLGAIAQALAGSGKSAEAVQVSQAISAPDLRDRTLVEITKILVGMRRLGDARSAAQSIRNDYWQREASSQVAAALLADRKNEEARGVCASSAQECVVDAAVLAARDFLKRADIVSVKKLVEWAPESLRLAVLAKMLTALKVSGRAGDAVMLSRAYQSLLRSVGPGYDSALTEVVGALREVDAAQAALAARAIEDGHARASALAGLALWQIERGDRAQALRLAREAMEAFTAGRKAGKPGSVPLDAVRTIALAGGEAEQRAVTAWTSDPAVQIEILEALADAFADEGERAEAQGAARNAITIARISRDRDVRMSLTAHAAVALARAGLRTEALEATRPLENSGIQLLTLARIARALAAAGDRRGVQLAGEQAASLIDGVDQGDELAEGGDAYHVRVDYVRALLAADNYAEAVRQARMGQYGSVQSHALAVIATALWASGKRTEAERMADEARAALRDGPMWAGTTTQIATYWSDAFPTLLEVLAFGGMVRKAGVLAQACEDSLTTGFVHHIAGNLADMGRLAEAHEFETVAAVAQCDEDAETKRLKELITAGRLEEADLAARSLRSDTALYLLMEAWLARGQPDRAEAILTHFHRQSPRYSAYGILAEGYLRLGRVEEAVRAARQSDDSETKARVLAGAAIRYMRGVWIWP